MLSLDIQVEIIKSLPVKSLIQFRSVCKVWKSLIDSSRFIAGYISPHDHLLISYEVGYGEENEVKYIYFVDDDDGSFRQQKFAPTVSSLVQAKATRIIGSSHGLLCLHCYSSKPQRVVLWNPTIRKSIVVALPNVLNLPFHYVLGFGVRPDTKDPIIVKITYILDDYTEMESINCIPCQVMVFTLSSGKWTTSSCTNHLPRKSIGFSSYRTVIVIGQFIYWDVFDRTAKADGYKFHNLIMSFDMSNGEFREIDVPDSLRESYFSISRLRESLVLLEYDLNFTTNKHVCDVWMMDDGDSKAFTKLFTINAPNASVLQTLGFRKSGEPIVELQDDKDYCALAVYKPGLEHIKDLGICGNKFSFFGIFYSESLLLLDHDDGRIVRCGAVKK